jgi:hypothetical protein
MVAAVGLRRSRTEGRREWTPVIALALVGRACNDRVGGFTQGRRPAAAAVADEFAGSLMPAGWEVLPGRDSNLEFAAFRHSHSKWRSQALDGRCERDQRRLKLFCVRS